MTRYSVQPKDRIFAKGYIYFLLLRIWAKSIDKNINRNFSSKYSQKILDHAKQLVLKLFQKTAESTGNLVCNKIANKITKVSKIVPQNTCETVESKTEIPREGYIYLQKEDQKLLII